MTDSTRRALRRFGKALLFAGLAAVIDAALSQVGSLQSVLPEPAFTLPVLTAILMAAQKKVQAERS